MLLLGWKRLRDVHGEIFAIVFVSLIHLVGANPDVIRRIGHIQSALLAPPGLPVRFLPILHFHILGLEQLEPVKLDLLLLGLPDSQLWAQQFVGEMLRLHCVILVEVELRVRIVELVVE